MNNKQADQTYKEDFEMKISKMNDRIQSELNETDEKLNFGDELFNRDPTYQEMLEDVQQKEKASLDK